MGKTSDSNLNKEKRSTTDRRYRDVQQKILSRSLGRRKQSTKSGRILRENGIRPNSVFEEETDARKTQHDECENENEASTSTGQGMLNPNEKPVINLRRCMYKVVGDIATEFGMIPTKDEKETWDVYWSDASMSTVLASTMEAFQRTNHFPGMANLESKAFLAHHLNRMRKDFPADYSFFPRSWSLPWQREKFSSYMKANPGKVFIFKPTRGAEGKGIKLFTVEDQGTRKLLTYQESVVQEYIPNPLLIDRYKFDLRLYVLLTSVDPLQIFVYNNGLVRLATNRFVFPNEDNLNNQFMHLTNYSINKNSPKYKESPETGNKRDFGAFNAWLEKEGCDSFKLWRDIDDVIVKTIISVLPMLKAKYEKSFPHHGTTSACFEILGMDILIDDTMTPYLLEVNRSPSFNIAGVIDERVKTPLLRDTFRLVNLGQNRRAAGQTDEPNSAQDTFSTIGPRDKCSYEEITWERKNSGNYRLIYPCQTCGISSFLYAKFIDHIFSLPGSS